MQFLLSKTGISVVVLVSLFAFLYFFSGVFGGTSIGITLRTNTNLENGLVAHYTFDSDSVSGYTVSDASGNGNIGSITATSSRENDVLVDSGLGSGSDSENTNASHQQVWLDNNTGYIFYLSSGSDIWVASTTDGGSTWGTDEITGNNTGKISVWYDRWTEGDEQGNTIHIGIASSADDELQYIAYDTVTDTASSYITVTTDGSTFGNSTTVSITKTAGGVLYMYAPDADGDVFARCALDCENVSNWTEPSKPSLTDASDTSAIVPIKGSENILLVYWDDSSADDLDYYVYSATSSSWWPGGEVATGYVSGGARELSVTRDKTTGVVYVAIIDDADDFVTEDHDIDLWEFNPSTYAWTEKTNVVTNASGGLEEVAVAVDENIGTIYVGYVRRSTIGTESTAHVYYKLSTDGGTTWSSEIGPISDSSSTLGSLTMNGMDNERIAAQWKEETADDLYFVTVEDIGDYPEDKVVSGNIGQGMTFDGVNDEVRASISSITDYPFTLATWVKANDSDVGTSQFSLMVGKDADEYYAIGFTGDQGGELRPGLVARNTSYSEEQGNLGAYVKTWTHIVGVFKSATERELYVNGEFENEETSSVSIVSGIDTLIVGNNFASAHVDGEIDDARVYNRGLSPDEVKRLYELGATTKVAKTLDTNPELQNGLVGHWTFDGEYTDISSSTKEIYDASGNGNYGDWGNHGTTTAAGVLGQAIYFDGIDDLIEIRQDDSLRPVRDVSFGTWFYSTESNDGSSGNGVELMSWDGGSADTFELLIDPEDSGQVASCRIDSGSDIGTGSFEADVQGEWHHAFCTYDGALIRLYVDGELEETAVQTGNLDYATFGNEALVIGEEGGFFEGYLDDVRMYDRALSDEEVRRLYELGATTKVGKTITTNATLESGLVGHWTFDGSDLWDNATDRSGNGNDAYLQFFSSTTTRPGAIGQAINFDGSDDYIARQSAVVSSAPLTMCLWFTTDSATTQQYLLWTGDKDSTQQEWYLLIGPDADANIRYAAESSALGAIDSSITVRNNEWYHACGVEVSSSLRYLYVNGELEGSNTDTLSPSGADRITFGYDGDSSPGDNLSGTLDDVRVYDRALTEAEIMRLYQLGQ